MSCRGCVTAAVLLAIGLVISLLVFSNEMEIAGSFVLLMMGWGLLKGVGRHTTSRGYPQRNFRKR
jgi:hypothetical protein